MRELLPTLSEWRREGAEVGRAVLVRAFASSPRRPGAVLLADDRDRIAGSVSGGCVEGAAAGEVRRARRDGVSRVVRYGISDEVAWDVGLACGGVIDVLVEPTVRSELIAAAEDVAAGRRSAVVTAMPSDAPGDEPGPYPTGAGETPGEIVRLEDPAAAPDGLADAVVMALRAGTAGIARGTSGRQWFIEPFPLAPRLIVVGAVHIGMALVRLAGELGYHTIVVDRRATFASIDRTADADEVIVAWPEDAFGRIGLGPDDAVAVLSHDAKLDEPAIVAALRAGCRYVGAIGSRKTQANRRERLLAAGLTASELDRLRGPIGLDLGGTTPAEVALAVLAEVVAERRGGTGSMMSATTG